MALATQMELLLRSYTLPPLAAAAIADRLAGSGPPLASGNRIAGCVVPLAVEYRAAGFAVHLVVGALPSTEHTGRRIPVAHIIAWLELAPDIGNQYMALDLLV